MKIINGQLYKTLRPKTGKIYVVGGELYGVLLYPAEGADTETAQGGASATVTVSAQGTGSKSMQGGSNATGTVVTPQGSGIKSTQGSSTATGTAVSAQATGVKVLSGSSTTAVEVAANGAGVKTAQGGVSATVTITPQGSGIKATQGGSNATGTVISAQGSGIKSAQGSSTAAGVVVSAQGSGVRVINVAQGGSTATVTITAQAAGVKVISAGSSVAVEVAAEGAGVKVLSGGANATGVVVSAQGTGIKSTQGGSEASFTITNQGGGQKSAQGSSEANFTIAPQGTGSKSTQGSATSTVTITAQGAGMRVINAIQGGSTATGAVISAQGAGLKVISAGSNATVTIAAQGAGVRVRQGGSEATGVVVSAEGKFAVLETTLVPLGVFWSGDWDAPEGELYATTTGRDRLELLRQTTYSTSTVQQDRTLYELAIAVLTDAGLTATEYLVDAELQDYAVPYSYFESQSHREALRKIAEACLGQVYCDREGIVRIEGPSYLQAANDPVLTITQDDYFSKSNPVKWSEIANYIEVETQPLLPDTAQEMYRSNDPVPISAGETKTITAFYNESPCIDAVASIEGTGTITEATYFAWGATVKVASATDGEFTLIINAKPLKVLNKEKAIAQDSQSIIDNGKIRYGFPANPLVQTLAVAQAIADGLLQFANPRRDVSLSWRGNPAVLLGDKAAIVDRQETASYFVTKQELEFDGTLRAKLEGRKA